ncbi:MAG: hypothetical protein KBF58_10910 [Methyloversatilis sp.]|nr:hypothetical protein [Methyloversatilis sp.]
MIIIPADIIEKVRRLAEQPAAMAVVKDVLQPLARLRAAGLTEINVDAVPHAISREQGFIRGIDDIARAFEAALKR